MRGVLGIKIDTPVKMLSEYIMLFWVVIAIVAVAATADHVNTYDRQQLLDLRLQANTLPPATLDTVKWLNELINGQNAIQENSYVKKNKRKRGKKGGIRARLRRRGTKTPLPAVMFGNVRSIRNKIDEFSANCKYLRDFRESSFISLTETWLQDKDVDETVNIDGFSLVRADRKDKVKQKGGGVAVYVKDKMVFIGEREGTFLL